MSNSDPITIWIEGLRSGEQTAALNVWNHFALRLLELGRSRLSRTTKRVYDENDVVQSMFRSVCLGFAGGKFPDLNDRESLWRLMLVITCQKIANRHRFDHQQKRDVRRTLSASVFSTSDSFDAQGHSPFISHEPAPEFVAEFIETCKTLFAQFDDPILEKITTLRLEGFSDSEIATQVDCSRRTVQRRLEIIRRKLSVLQPAASLSQGNSNGV